MTDIQKFQLSQSKQVLTLVAGFVIIIDNKVLLVKDTDPFWKIPGGKMRFDESMLQTCQRTLNDELNIATEYNENTSPFIHEIIRRRTLDTQYRYIIFHFFADNYYGELQTKYEYKWFDLKEVLDGIFEDNVKLAIKHYIDSNFVKI